MKKFAIYDFRMANEIIRKSAIENQNPMILKKLKQSPGFSIIEASIVMAVVSIGLLGVFSLVMQNIQVQRGNKNMLVASMLAQEGIEMVRNVRDENWLVDPTNWDIGIADGADFDFKIDTDGIIDIDDASPANITDSDNARLFLDSVTNFYTHTSTGNIPTQYYRLITATPGGDLNSDGEDDYYKIKSHVQWQDRGVLKDYIAETYLYDWK
ncbi:MAG: Type 4 fimbrial biogenesis protein PilV [Candidatus Falkowbacteria bacterium GW2011_GWC2_38_22]|uniref:Type 4 fimbrial biogenesis protein PilV n=1 Tax=Candidatus Falkowbacteria bacterium GW2011_GWE1_38_31 TaxID=1618638 RepID=A0A0G0JTC4_9BACT|nr:MAG: Type 4 fimbrial biogenesis protein PilV [Candidatus Falkowbacteria bacterium GW2011_GWF2_38_1205]KKQ61309.1 MAG: Type 4 fimbrial biogenesis protein PilV [Candidatus Falkowbacteria bacterium GW2011_GWC2_38_22]KKQ63119.1 MAG: Type 4 fimbrial biogenesis protein PilV [Candidatus Falkowbacteria bacterium GW2011_GWF1_38_22]KKQ65316.1 MAG: Type 4 fimbrial biogenesis protein PilV [Candidatus Falkowbacteria bacterium GW2011_GWE2_38_254]KKQ69892.1 MAG: Type 4 fimbrial biogenesis protein PilV [Can